MAWWSMAVASASMAALRWRSRRRQTWHEAYHSMNAGASESRRWRRQRQSGGCVVVAKDVVVEHEGTRRRHDAPLYSSVHERGRDARVK